MIRIAKSLLIIVAVAVVAVGATGALFSDTEYVAGNTFAAGTLDLQVGSTNPTTWVFGAGNMAPGANVNSDTTIANIGTIDGDASITFHVNNSDEGVNPPAETEITPDGDLEEQMRIMVYMREDGVGGWQNIGIAGFADVLNGNTYDIPDAQDAWINDSSTNTEIRVRAWFVEDTHGFSTGDNNDTMGDSFDLDMDFHLDQI